MDRMLVISAEGLAALMMQAYQDGWDDRHISRERDQGVVFDEYCEAAKSMADDSVRH